MTKLRIIAGEFGGRLIKSTDNNITHPMGDRVRSAMFAKLSSRANLENARILDVFAGTGALGFESLSRGAKSVEFVENDHIATKIIWGNANLLNVETKVKISKFRAEKWLENFLAEKSRAKYDVVFIDPPYDKLAKLAPLVKAFVENVCIRENIVILSWRSGEALPDPKGVVVVAIESYGEATLVFYRKIDD